MKKKLVLLLVYLLVGCNSYDDSNKLLETIAETAECIIGEWTPEKKDPKNAAASYHFFKKPDKGNGENSGTFKIFYYKPKWVSVGQNKREKVASDQIREREGRWRVSKPGEITVDLFPGKIRIKLTNCGRLVARNKFIFLKK